MIIIDFLLDLIPEDAVEWLGLFLALVILGIFCAVGYCGYLFLTMPVGP